MTQSEQATSRTVSLSVHYAIRIPVDVAEEIVGRPWAHDGDDDDTWECDLEEAVKHHLPDLLDYTADDPDVEWYG